MSLEQILTGRNAEVAEIYDRLRHAETGNEPDSWIRTKHKAPGGSSAFGEVQITQGLIKGVLSNPKEYNLDEDDMNTLQQISKQQDLMLKYGGKDMVKGFERYDYGKRGDFSDEDIPKYRKAVGKVMLGLYNKHIDKGNSKDDFWKVWRFGEKDAKTKDDPSYYKKYSEYGKEPSELKKMSDNVSNPATSKSEFNKAFAKARKEGLNVFTFNNKKYTTDLKRN
jgi:hypothetical protein